MCYHVAGARCARVWGQNCPPHTFYFNMCQGRWARSHNLQIIQYLRASSLELRASVHNSYRFNLFVNSQPEEKWLTAAWLKHLQEPQDCFPCRYWPCDGCRYIINHLHSHFGMQYPPSKCWLFFSIVIKAIAAVGTRAGRGGAKPQKLKIDQAVWEGAVGGTCGLPWECRLAFTVLSPVAARVPLWPFSCPNSDLLIGQTRGIKWK